LVYKVSRSRCLTFLMCSLTDLSDSSRHAGELDPFLINKSGNAIVMDE
ncbi:MAG: hypothetical protein K0Q56_2279, partial [Sporolactobacillus laevolacticus]|nr:hypothetical protein [Sporolactobacillus laevolacticus]